MDVAPQGVSFTVNSKLGIIAYVWLIRANNVSTDDKDVQLILLVCLVNDRKQI